MKNIKIIEQVLDYIEEHLQDEQLNLETISKQIGYSKYHLHRMFASVIGFNIHNYIQRRRLTESARMLIYSNLSIIEIALCSGYESQRAFSKVFKNIFKVSPGKYRKCQEFYPLQLKFDIHNHNKLRGDMILDIKTIDYNQVKIVGYNSSTKNGFHVIGKCWHKLHKNKTKIIDRLDQQFLIGVNDYSEFKTIKSKPIFNFIAGAEVSTFNQIPKEMKTFILPASKYIIFVYKGRSEDSVQPIVDYIYHEWLLNSSCQLNEKNRYDIVKYGEEVDKDGLSEIQYWIPVN
ncbi:MAG: helix-turn-helix domain-containing protein [Thomasclavelia sp.]|uniref:AraC family transcriptional regulator n=1 Tax=Thomasclavelia sp. TaxID=3025757 RepID=UPI0039A357DD